MNVNKNGAVIVGGITSTERTALCELMAKAGWQIIFDIMAQESSSNADDVEDRYGEVPAVEILNKTAAALMGLSTGQYAVMNLVPEPIHSIPSCGLCGSLNVSIGAMTSVVKGQWVTLPADEATCLCDDCDQWNDYIKWIPATTAVTL